MRKVPNVNSGVSDTSIVSNHVGNVSIVRSVSSVSIVSIVCDSKKQNVSTYMNN